MGHKEAFCLMMYESDDGSIMEWIWNSRDGVTPFSVSSLSGETMLTHTDFYRDLRAPFHVPPIGSRVFVDLTEQRALHFAQLRVENALTAIDPERRAAFQARWKNENEAVKAIAKDLMKMPGEPDILVVNKAMQDQFREAGALAWGLARARHGSGGSGRFA